MDLSGLSNADLKALQANNLQAVSNAGLKYLQNQMGGAPAAPAPQPGLLSRLGSDIAGGAEQLASYPAAALSGIGQGTRDLLNLPMSLANFAGRKLAGHNVVPELPQVEPLSQMTGLQSHPAVSAIASFIPAMATGEAAAPALAGLADTADAGKLASSMGNMGASPIGQQVAAGGLYGASQDSNNPLRGALENAALSGVVGKGMQALGGIGKPVAKYLAGKVVDPLMGKAGAMMQQAAPDQTGPTALGLARQAVADQNNYAGLTPLAQQADNATNFNNENFVSALKNMKDNMAQEYKANPKGTQPIITAIQDEIDNPPTSFEDALNKNKAYNELPSTWETTNNSMAKRMRGLSGQLKTALNNTVQDNAAQTPEAQNFLNQWNNQKANYAKLQSYSQLPTGYNKSGGLNLAYSNKLAKEMQAGGVPSPDVMSNFLPTASQDSTMKMQHFANLIGDQPAAQQILKQNYMQPAMESGTFDPNKAMQLYQKLSPDQRNWLFNPQENALMGRALQAQKAGGNSKFGQMVAKHLNQTGLGLLGGVLGATYGHEVGQAAIPALLTGAATGYALPMVGDIAASKLANPAGAAKVIQYAKQGLNLQPASLGVQALLNPLYTSVFRGH